MNCSLIVGKPNVGKTLFFLNFAEYLGLDSIKVTIVDPDKTENTVTYSPDRARELFVGATAHTTQRLQSVVVSLPVGKGSRRLLLVDTSGLVEGIHESAAVRRAMAQTLRSFRDAELVLHMVDASNVGREDAVEAMGELDLQLARYGPLRVPYLLLVNKMDLPWARTGLRLIKQKFEPYNIRIIPVSALEKQGFREVREFLQRHV
jgi:50S ribosomal subunit-associated GTPase HflX